MVRTVKNGREEDDFEEDHEFASTALDVSPPKGKVEKTSDQKVNPVRSKHSETEQRRRSKINERFQVLRDLIPENDQKRDKASFLLEVIQYIQFLQERIQAYEGTCQGWSPEPSKLMSWVTSVIMFGLFQPVQFRLTRLEFRLYDFTRLSSVCLCCNYRSYVLLKGSLGTSATLSLCDHKSRV